MLKSLNQKFSTTKKSITAWENQFQFYFFRSIKLNLASLYMNEPVCSQSRRCEGNGEGGRDIIPTLRQLLRLLSTYQVPQVRYFQITLLILFVSCSSKILNPISEKTRVLRYDFKWCMAIFFF